MPAELADAAASLTIRAARADEADVVARVRSRCYRASYSLEPRMREAVENDRADLAGGDVLLAEKDGRLVATVTSLRGEMNVRGAVLPCQGIAWVGTTHDARRSGGVASAVMRRALGLGRERGDVLSALMPFRASYYEHFGYGLCERRALWSVPIPILPQGEAPSFRFVEPDDQDLLGQIADCRRRQFTRTSLGHGDVDFPQADLKGFGHWARYYAEKGYLFADIADDGSVRGALGVHPVERHGQHGLQAMHTIFDDIDGFLRQLTFLGTLRDQYGMVEIATPVDVPLNRLLREAQLPHRGVEHPHATCEISARNQVRVLDHLRLLEAMPWPDSRATGRVTIAVRENEGHESRFTIDVADGGCSVSTSSATPDFTCVDKTWTPIVLGEITAESASRYGLAQCDNMDALSLLNTLSHGPAPFCREFF